MFFLSFPVRVKPGRQQESTDLRSWQPTIMSGQQIHFSIMPLSHCLSSTPSALIWFDLLLFTHLMSFFFLLSSVFFFFLPIPCTHLLAYIFAPQASSLSSSPQTFCPLNLQRTTAGTETVQCVSPLGMWATFMKSEHSICGGLLMCTVFKIWILYLSGTFSHITLMICVLFCLYVECLVSV